MMAQGIVNPWEFYQVRSGAIDLGREYEYKILTFLALRCLAQDVNDMWIASNSDGLGAFDDIVLRVKILNKHVTYLMQLKHKDNAKNITRQEFMSERGDYSVKKYADDIAKMQKRDSSDDVYYVIFTNRGNFNCECLELDDSDDLSFLNTTTDNRNVYKFNFQKLPQLSNITHSNSKINLLTKQVNAKHLDKTLEEELKNLLRCFQLTRVNVREITELLVKFIVDWAKGDLGGHYFLRKKDVSNKLCELLLSKFQVDLSTITCHPEDYDPKLIWNRILNDKLLTIVECDEINENFLKAYIGKQLKTYCSGEFEILWQHQLTDEVQNRFYQTHVVLKKALLRIIGNFGKITLYHIYKCLWFSNELPLLLKIYRAEEFENINKILKMTNYTLSVIVLNKSMETLPLNMTVPNRFVSLNDLSKEFIVEILGLPVTMQGRSLEALDAVVDESMHKCIKCADIIRIITNQFNIGNVYEELYEYFIERDVLKIIIKFEVLQMITDEFFFVESNPSDEDMLASKLNEINAPNVFTADLQSLKSKAGDKPIHWLIFLDDSYLEWKESWGTTKNIRKHQVQLNAVFEEPFTNTRIISACPGMGKTTFLDFIAINTPTGLWVLKVTLTEHDDYYDKMTDKSAFDYLRYFNESILVKYKCDNIELARAVFERFLENGRVLVLLDGFDEVFFSKDEVTTLTKIIHDEGFPIRITTRSHLKSHLEDAFETIAYTLKPFTFEDQVLFLMKYFIILSECTDLELIFDFIKELLISAQNNFDSIDLQFMGVPLQTKLLAEVFSDQLLDSVKEGTVRFNHNFDLINLYDEFIKKKTNIVCSRFGRDAKTVRSLFLKHQQLFALKFIFEDSHLSNLNFDELKCYQFEENRRQFLQRDGIITIDNQQKLKIGFVHRTFAEYLSAQWLFQNYNNISEYKIAVLNILKLRHNYMYSFYYKFLFRLFDRMLIKGLPIHVALVNKQMAKAKQLIANSEGVEMIDAGGRTILHVVASMGKYHSSEIEPDFSQYKNDKMLEILSIIPDSTLINLFIPDSMGFTPLDISVLSKSFAVANNFCAKFPNININVMFMNDIGYAIGKHLSNCLILDYVHLLDKSFSFILKKHLLERHFKNCEEPNETYYQKFIDIYPDNSLMYNKIEELKTETIFDLLEKLKIKLPFVFYYNDLRFAVVFGESSCIDRLLIEGCDINEIDCYGNSPLHYAVKHNRDSIVEFLLSKGADVNKSDANGNTVLHIASKNGYSKITKQLLACNIDVNQCDFDGNTSLMLSIGNDHTDIIEMLILNNANVRTENTLGSSCLHAAVTNSKKLVLNLLEKGADVDKRDKFGCTPLTEAIKNGCTDIAKLLLSKDVNISTLDVNGNSYLHHAVKRGTKDIVLHLINNGLDIDMRNDAGDTPLLIALDHYSTSTAKLLISMNADINIENKNGCSSLYYAVKANSMSLIRQLFESGLDINKQTEEGLTPLMLAIQKQSRSVAKFFLSNGANRDVTDKNGNSLLHLAAKHNDYGMLSELLLEGCNVNEKNNFNQTPLQYTLHDIKYFDRGDSKTQMKIVNLLVNNGVDLNQQDEKGETAMHYVCRYKTDMELCINDQYCKKFCIHALELFLNRGMNFSLKNCEEKTALDVARDNKNDEMSSLIYQKIVDKYRPIFKSAIYSKDINYKLEYLPT